jgi:hypothetical protein
VWLRVDATMRLVAEFRQIASDYRRLAALLTKTTDKQALELFAIGWDKIADNREAMLRNEEQAESTLNLRLTGHASLSTTQR